MKEFSGKNLEVDSAGGELEGRDMSIDAAGMRFVFDIMFNQMYRDPIGSVIREITSNCFDSHIEAKVDDPVVIEFNEDEGGQYIAFKDVGMGISPERMEKVYSKPTSSTKRDSQELIGYWGLGSKSPLAYDDFFYLTTVHDGIEYQYVIHKGERGPRIDDILKQETDQPNGSVVKVYIKSNSDRQEFINKLNYQLRYFDNVYVTGITFPNEYKIHQGKHWKLRNDTPSTEVLHICIGKVTYPIDWRLIGMKTINLPFALKFDIGDLPITPERESIKYVTVTKDDGTEVSVKEIVINKIKLFLEELESMVADMNYEHNNILDFEDNQTNRAYVKVGEKFIDVTEHIKAKRHVFTPFEPYGMQLPNNPFFVFNVVAVLDTWAGGKVTKVKEEFDRVLTLNEFRDALLVRQYKAVGKYRTMISDYLKKLCKDQGKTRILFIAPSKIALNKATFLRGSIFPKVRKVDYSQYNKGKLWRHYRNVITAEVLIRSVDYFDLSIPDAFITQWQNANKSSDRLTADEGEIIAEDIKVQALKFRKRTYDLEDLQEYKGFIIYGFTEDIVMLEHWAEVFLEGEYTKTSEVLKIKVRDEKHLIGLKHTINVRSFMSDNPIFRKVATAAIVEDSSVWSYGFLNLGSTVKSSLCRNEAMNKLFTPVAEKLNELKSKTENCINLNALRGEDAIQFKTEILELARNNEWFDKDVVADVEKVEKYFKGLELINYIVCSDKALPHVARYFQLAGRKINPEWNSLEAWQDQLIKESIERVAYYSGINEELQRTPFKSELYFPKSCTNYYEKQQIFIDKKKATLRHTEYLQKQIVDLTPLIQTHGTKKTITN